MERGDGAAPWAAAAEELAGRWAHETRWRGVRRDYTFPGHTPSFSILSDKAKNPPWGLFGGHDALPNKLSVRRADGRIEEFPNGKVSMLKLAPGEAYSVEAGGGGGYGSPLERPAGWVQRDVREGYVSLAAARDVYGVVLDPATFLIDEAATARQRQALLKAPPAAAAAPPAGAGD